MKEQEFTIGQVEKITGISKDRLRNYDKKNILSPSKQEENQYRTYRTNDIIEVLGVEYLRAMDLGLTDIKSIRETGDIRQLTSVLEKKEQETAQKIQTLKKTLEMLQKAQAECRRIQNNIANYSLTSMPNFRVLGTLSETTSFLEYEHLRKEKNDDSPILKSIMRKMLFSEKGVYQNEVLIIDDSNCDTEVLFPKCLYTVVEEKVLGEDVTPDIFQKSMKWITENGYEATGEVYVKPLMISFPKQELICYLEIYIPLK